MKFDLHFSPLLSTNDCFMKAKIATSTRFFTFRHINKSMSDLFDLFYIVSIEGYHIIFHSVPPLPLHMHPYIYIDIDTCAQSENKHWYKGSP